MLCFIDFMAFDFMDHPNSLQYQYAAPPEFHL
jgi:hypothetical protein